MQQMGEIGVRWWRRGEGFLDKCYRDNANTIVSDYALTSKPCPPFRIQHMDFAHGVETIGELAGGCIISEFIT